MTCLKINLGHCLWIGPLDFNEARDDGVAVASAGPHAKYVHLAPDRQPRQHLITQSFTGWMLFLTSNQQCRCTEGIWKAVIQKLKILSIYYKLQHFLFYRKSYAKCHLASRNSVRPSHACFVTNPKNVFIPHERAIFLVFWCQRSRRNSNGVTPNGGAK